MRWNQLIQFKSSRAVSVSPHTQKTKIKDNITNARSNLLGTKERMKTVTRDLEEKKKSYSAEVLLVLPHSLHLRGVQNCIVVRPGLLCLLLVLFLFGKMNNA